MHPQVLRRHRADPSFHPGGIAGRDCPAVAVASSTLPDEAQVAGTVTEIDTRSVGMAVVALGGGRTMPTDSIDHTVGFDRLAGIGTKVDVKTPIARLHARDEASAADAEARLKSAYRLGDGAPAFPIIADRIAPT